MTHSAELIERVARALWEDNDRYCVEIGLLLKPSLWGQELLENKERFRDSARAALSAMPGHELLREALEALQVFADYAKTYDEYSLAQFGLIELDTHVMGSVHRGDPGHPKNVTIVAGDLRRARATAEKLRQALTQDQP